MTFALDQIPGLGNPNKVDKLLPFVLIEPLERLKC